MREYKEEGSLGKNVPPLNDKEIFGILMGSGLFDKAHTTGRGWHTWGVGTSIKEIVLKYIAIERKNNLAELETGIREKLGQTFLHLARNGKVGGQSFNEQYGVGDVLTSVGLSEKGLADYMHLFPQEYQNSVTKVLEDGKNAKTKKSAEIIISQSSNVLADAIKNSKKIKAPDVKIQSNKSIPSTKSLIDLIDKGKVVQPVQPIGGLVFK